MGQLIRVGRKRWPAENSSLYLTVVPLTESLSGGSHVWGISLIATSCLPDNQSYLRTSDTIPVVERNLVHLLSGQFVVFLFYLNFFFFFKFSTFTLLHIRSKYLQKHFTNKENNNIYSGEKYLVPTSMVLQFWGTCALLEYVHFMLIFYSNHLLFNCTTFQTEIFTSLHVSDNLLFSRFRS